MLTLNIRFHICRIDWKKKSGNFAEMIYLLFKIVFTEMALILTLLFRNPLRKLVILGLDKLKQGRGPLVAKSVGATVVVVLCSTVYSAMEIQNRAREGGGINPTDEVLMANLLLQASLMGFSLFLAMITDRLHYYIKELHLVRQTLEGVINLNKHHDRQIRATEETTESKEPKSEHRRRIDTAAQH